MILVEYINRNSRGKKFLISAVFLIALVSIIYNIYLFQKTEELKDPQAFAAKQVKKITDEISKFMILPKDETPSLATISDVSKLKDQPFFANAVEGDQVIVYNNARKAILWRPSKHKIVEVAPLTTSPVSASVNR